MPKDRIYPSTEEIRRVMRRLPTISTAERALVEEVMQRIKPSGISQSEFHTELYKLRSKYAISETDMRALEDAFFSDGD